MEMNGKSDCMQSYIAKVKKARLGFAIRIYTDGYCGNVRRIVRSF